MDKLQQAINLRDKIIEKENKLNQLRMPNQRYSKRDLRSGMQGRVQRRENKRYSEMVMMQKRMYAKKRNELNKYIEGLINQPQPINTLGIIRSQSSQVIQAPLPKVGFWELPQLKRIRNLRRKR